jgi:hypothetical protein
MASEWINHVKAFSKANSCSYKDAMKLAKPSYNPKAKPKKGGDLKTVVRKARNTAKRVSQVSKKATHLMDVSNPLLEVLEDELPARRKAQFQVAKRKTQNTAKRVSRVASKVAPVIGALAGPEAAAAVEGVNQVAKKLSGGSFKTMGGGMHMKRGQKAHCVQCGGSIGFGRSESSVISDTHNSFNPLKPKSFKDKMHTN